jgi:hypothetical protein
MCIYKNFEFNDLKHILILKSIHKIFIITI